jgi:hypothetical protein
LRLDQGLPKDITMTYLTRREMLTSAGAGFGAVALAGLLVAGLGVANLYPCGIALALAAAGRATTAAAARAPQKIIAIRVTALAPARFDGAELLESLRNQIDIDSRFAGCGLSDATYRYNEDDETFDLVVPALHPIECVIFLHLLKGGCHAAIYLL